MILLDHIISSNAQTDIIYLDIRKAFDSILHRELLVKLQLIGVKGKLLKWFQSYLSHRVQRVRINNSLSSPLPVVSGVPQGSILGPLLFIIYMNDLPCCLSTVKSLLYVDDTKCYLNVHRLTDSSVLQENLNAIISWSQEWHLTFNPNKCVFVRFKPILQTSYDILGTQLVA